MIAQAVTSGPAYRRTHPARPRDAWEQQRLDAARQFQRRRSTRAPASASPAPLPPARRGVGYG
jgi:hypothetical protein